MKLKHLTLLSTAFVFSLQASAVGNPKADRWFEMEVILFSQLGDKAKLKEQFPKNSALPNYKRVIDLLGPYLNPDISSLKQLLPSCDKPSYKESFLDQAITTIKEQPYYIEQTLVELENAILETNDDKGSSSYFSDGTDTPNSLEKNSLVSPDFDNTVVDEQPKAITDEELAARSILLLQAKDEFSTIKLNHANETASFTKLICTISVEEFNQLNNKNTYDSYTAFNIDKMPDVINDSEDLYSDNDYLLNNESLKLHSIVKQLKRSKNFKPLLHFGWRQKTKTKRLAVPMKVYAGENYAYNYEQELQQYHQQLELEESQEQTLKKALFENNSSLNERSNEGFKQQEIAERIQELIVKLPNLPTDTANLLNEVDNDVVATQGILNSNNLLSKPVKPPQNWTIDGFLKVEVDFYLHITADFNVMNMSLAQLATQKLLPESEFRDSAQLESINFKQDRRVRSKEIHYFDHPYMGMIIRILPYKKPIKEVEVTTSEN